MQHHALTDYERISLERLKLAADVILAEADSPAVTDALEAELSIFRDHVEHALLLPDRPKPDSSDAPSRLPWRDTKGASAYVC